MQLLLEVFQWAPGVFHLLEGFCFWIIPWWLSFLKPPHRDGFTLETTLRKMSLLKSPLGVIFETTPQKHLTLETTPRQGFPFDTTPWKFHFWTPHHDISPLKPPSRNILYWNYPQIGFTFERSSINFYFWN